jgi:hypothetical protein
LHGVFAGGRHQNRLTKISLLDHNAEN